MRAIADLFIFIVRLNLETQLAAIDFEQLGTYSHFLALRRSREWQ